MRDQLRAPATRRTLLSVGYDSTALAGRNLAFQQAGYRVLAAGNFDTALNSILADPLDVMVLCHTIPLTEQQRLIEAARRHRPHARICVLAKGNALMAA